MIRSIVRRVLAPCLFAVGAVAAHAEEDYAATWGPAVGEPAPALLAPDENGRVRDLTSLGRENGLLLLFNRSVDW